MILIHISLSSYEHMLPCHMHLHPQWLESAFKRVNLHTPASVTRCAQLWHADSRLPGDTEAWEALEGPLKWDATSHVFLSRTIERFEKAALWLTKGRWVVTVHSDWHLFAGVLELSLIKASAQEKLKNWWDCFGSAWNLYYRGLSLLYYMTLMKGDTLLLLIIMLLLLIIRKYSCMFWFNLTENCCCTTYKTHLSRPSTFNMKGTCFERLVHGW